ncbi:helix-turn-helix domain-containing protein [Streptomyces thermolineatus]|uniref:helix-turn-helix domain-containing protein n=1 Tax=Streptomyces thermolineatus TaxID=44033 RepID=UPI00384C2762
MSKDVRDGIGARVASFRKLAGYTQSEFAEYANISLGGIRKVERGERLPTHGWLAAAARVLQVTVEDLTGQPYRGQEPADERVHAPIAAIRAVARSYDIPPDWATRPRPLSEIARDVQRAAHYRAGAHYTKLGQVLPALLEELTAAVHHHTGKPKREAARLLSSAYYMAHSLTYRLGYPDLAAQLDDRLRWAADLSGDPLTVALAQWSRAGGFQTAREYGKGLRLLADARDELDDVGLVSPAAVTLMGSLRLREATLASRARDEAATQEHFEAAALLADRVPDGADRVHYHLTFGPTNVAVHDVAAQVELRRPEEAAKKARLLHIPPALPRTRAGHHHIDAARAFLAAGDRDDALASLQQARQVAPQQTRYHPMARETARLLAKEYRTVTNDVRSLLHWMTSAPLSS